MKKFIPLIFLTAVLLIVQTHQTTAANTRIVNTLDDSDDGLCDSTHCSLREAIHYTAPGDTIDFSVTGTIELDGTQLIIDKSLTIAGPGEALLTISANTSSPSMVSRVFYIHSASSTLEVTISGLSIANGNEGTQGAGIYNEGENLTILNCVISNNTAREGGGGIYNNGTLQIGTSTLANNATTGGPGGGLYNEGVFQLENSTISGNSAVNGAGGGIYNADVETATGTVDNSTIFDNHADSNRYWGGGIGNARHAGMLSINRSTIAANSANNPGGGLKNKGDSLILANTIIANNFGGGDCYSDTPFTDGGYNLIEGTNGDTCGLVNGVNGNIIGLDPLIAVDLGDYGGPTLTLPLLFTSSPAFDAIPVGVNGCLAGSSNDQRGELRAGGTTDTGYFACDIGAFEFGSGAGYTLNQVFLPLVCK